MAQPPRDASDAPDALFARIYDAERSYVRRTLRRLGVPEFALDDETQTVFLHVFRRFDAFDRARPIRPWLYAFCRRTASNHARLAHSRIGFVPLHEASDPTTEPVESWRAHRLRAALASLPRDARNELGMYVLEGLSAPELAALSDEAPERVHARLRTTRRQLRRTLAPLKRSSTEE
ncbi:MAG: sigma-70 family RNA polymerase sigma factor [Myxococcota bacterium]